jgi:hypothetical protein
VAILNTNSSSLLNADSKLLANDRSNYDDAGFFFEAQVITQLRNFCELIGAELNFYRDSNNLEIDAIVEYKNKISVFEIKIGSFSAIKEGVKTFKKFRSILSEETLKNITS